MPFMFKLQNLADVDSKKKFLVIRFDCARFPCKNSALFRGYLSRNTRGVRACLLRVLLRKLRIKPCWTQE